MAGDVHCRGHTWQGGGIHGRGLHGRGLCGRGHAWQGACVVGGMHDRGACMAGEMATAAGGIHPTGMHSCFFIVDL